MKIMNTENLKNTKEKEYAIDEFNKVCLEEQDSINKVKVVRDYHSIKYLENALNNYINLIENDIDCVKVIAEESNTQSYKSIIKLVEDITQNRKNLSETELEINRRTEEYNKVYNQ